MPAEPKTVQRIDPTSFYIPVEKLPFFQQMMGGIPRATITALLGSPGACKSTLAGHLCVEAAKAEKGNILILDTENKFHVFLHLAAVLSNRYGVAINPVRVRTLVEKGGTPTEPKYEVSWELEDEIDPKAMNMFVVHCPDIKALTTIFGRRCDLKSYESGKFTVIMPPGGWIDDIEDTAIARFLSKYKCKILLIDSVTNPLDVLPAVQNNFPARTDLTQAWMLQAHSLAATYNLPILATFHETRNEAGMTSQDLDIEGGKAVKYNLAFVVYLLLKNEKGLLPKAAVKPTTLASDQRAMYVTRHGSTDVAPWKDVRYFRINKTGLHDGLTGDGETEEQVEEKPE